MKKFSLLFESPPWLIGLGVLIGIAYAVLLYYKIKGPWGQKMNYLLAAIRFLMVAQLTLLLFGPLIRQIKNTKEAPSLVLAFDNSKSIAEVEDSSQLKRLLDETQTLRDAFEKKGYLIDVRTLSGEAEKPADIKFDENSSNLNELLRQIRNSYESRNLSKVILFSDGLYNLGINPSFHPFDFEISAVGLGDTVQQSDINLNAVLYNKIAYQGNKFPVVAEVFSHNMTGKPFTIQVSQRGNIIEKKIVDVKSPDQFDRVEFFIEAKQSGMQRYTVEILPMEGEFSVSNNKKDVFIDIIDGKEKILLIAAAPHPDIKAFRSAIEKNENYELVIYIEGVNEYKPDKYDAVILHQVPDRRQQYRSILDKIQHEKIPAFFIYGSQSNFQQFNTLNGATKIQFINGQTDEIFPEYNPDYSTFKYDIENAEVINEYPPVTVPFANYFINPQSDILLYQRVGKINTKKPLLITVNDDNWKRAVLMGEGVWRWRLQEYAENENHKAFDEMISKVIQFLSTKEDKRKFKVYPVKNEFLSNEVVVFESEVYNDIYEQTYGHKIDLKITDEENTSNSYSYVTSEQNTRYRISGLDNGIYQYEAKTNINGKVETASGTFSIIDLQVETTKLTADHNLMRNIARQNNGKFYKENQLEKLRNDILDTDPVSKIYSTEKYLSIINMKWGFFVLLLFVSAEWFLRKYHGSY